MRARSSIRLALTVSILLAGSFICSSVLAQTKPAALPVNAWTPIIVDTDAGTDDLLALAFLLARDDVHIEAITIVNGNADVSAGTANVLALLQLADRADIPVYSGTSAPIEGDAAFPVEWREIADELPSVHLPKEHAKAQDQTAVSFLSRRLADSTHLVRILALGPLTNLGAVLRDEPSAAAAIQEMVIMGGAVNVPGNLGDGGVFKTNNTTAEWNIYIDPLAASIVFGANVPIRLIPLDATQHVPIHEDFVTTLNGGAKTPLAQFAAQVLASDADAIRQGYFYAWDPLAAVALVDPSVVQTVPMRIEIRTSGIERGRTIQIKTGETPNARVAISADAALFRREFLEALTDPRKSKP